MVADIQATAELEQSRQQLGVDDDAKDATEWWPDWDVDWWSADWNDDVWWSHDETEQPGACDEPTGVLEGEHGEWSTGCIHACALFCTLTPSFPFFP